MVGAKYATMNKAWHVASQSSYLNGRNVPNCSSHNRSEECRLGGVLVYNVGSGDKKTNYSLFVSLY